ncbi:MAG: tyrosine-type recombinase/integrase [Bacteroides intestinalis]|nr:tyrosine-type recombinase/integrase [Bacteroides intestinalis]
MQKIIESFAEESEGSEYLFPIMGKREDDGRRLYETAMRAQNRRLKRLSKLAGIGKNITTHVARHSWATICKNELLPMSVICEGLGHSSEKMTRKYLASFNYSILGNAGKAVLTAISRSSSSVLAVAKPISV